MSHEGQVPMFRFVADSLNYVSFEKTDLCLKYYCGTSALSVLHLLIFSASVNFQKR